jgi:hypothetical protein
MAFIYIPPSSNGVQNYNDLKNRPFYATKDTAILVDTTTVSLWEGGANLPHFGIVEGERYTVTLDDVVYTAVAYFNETAQTVTIGNIESVENVENENLNPPFFIISPDEETTLIYISYRRYDSHTIKIEGVIETVVPLDEKYLPKSVAGKRNDNNSEIFNDHVNNVVYGEYAHSEGFNTTAHSLSHAEGMGTTAKNDGAHAEGYYTNSEGMGSHSEGYHTNAKAQASHTEGVHTKAEQMGSHAEGYYTTANCQYQHVQGKYNIVDNENKYAHIVGNGSGEWNSDFGTYSRSNAHTLDWEGNAWFAGKVSIGTNETTLATEEYVKNEIAKASLEGDGEIDLTGFASKSDIPTKISQLTNDSGYITSIPSEYVTESELTAKKYTVEGHAHDQYLTKIPSEYITETELNAKGYLTQHQDLSAYAKKTELPTVPTKVSELTNDKNYLTSVPSEYVTETELNNKKYLTQHQNISHLASKTDISNMFSFDSNGYLVVTINGVTKKFVPADDYDNAQVIDDSELSNIMGDIPYDK